MASFWSNPPDDQAGWDDAIATAEPSAMAWRFANFVAQAASQQAELYLGGNDTAYLIQLLSGPGDGGDLDIIASLLTPTRGGGTTMCCTQRAEAACRIVAHYADYAPGAPLLLERSPGSFEYVLWGVPNEPWSQGPVTLQRLRVLAALEHRDRVAFYLPSAQAEQHCRFPHRPAVAIADAAPAAPSDFK